MTVFMGDDWAEDHHDVYLMNEDGKKLAGRRLPEGLDGIRSFHELVADHIDDPAEVIVGIETDRGLWVTALVAAGYQVYAINPLAASRYRDRHNVGGAKSDPGDAKMLADVVRTDRHNHRQIAGDTPEAEAIRIMARGHQNLIWTRNRQTNALRSALREYYPAALPVIRPEPAGRGQRRTHDSRAARSLMDCPAMATDRTHFVSSCCRTHLTLTTARGSTPRTRPTTGTRRATASRGCAIRSH